eukprot:g3641.t1
MDTGVQSLKKQRLHDNHGPSLGDSLNHDCTGGEAGQPCIGFGSLPSKEAVASMGLEAKVDMATHGHASWALTSLGAWRDRSMSASGDAKSAAFIKSRQREARRAMLGGGAAAIVGAPTPVVGNSDPEGFAGGMAVR